MAMMAGMNRFFASTRRFESRLRKAGWRPGVATCLRARAAPGFL